MPGVFRQTRPTSSLLVEATEAMAMLWYGLLGTCTWKRQAILRCLRGYSQPQSGGMKLSDVLPQRRAFVPSTETMVEATTCGWIQHYPKPQWLMTDPATCFTSKGFGEWTSRSGLGLFSTAGEAHRMLGSIEGLIETLKLTGQRLLTTIPELTLYAAACLAVAAHNVQERVGGYSPVQWAFGARGTAEADIPMLDDASPEGLARTELHRIEAEKTYIGIHAGEKASKLKHALRRPLTNFTIGDVGMFFRKWARIRPLWEDDAVARRARSTVATLAKSFG